MSTVHKLGVQVDLIIFLQVQSYCNFYFATFPYFCYITAMCKYACPYTVCISIRFEALYDFLFLPIIHHCLTIHLIVTLLSLIAPSPSPSLCLFIMLLCRILDGNDDVISAKEWQDDPRNRTLFEIAHGRPPPTDGILGCK